MLVHQFICVRRTHSLCFIYHKSICICIVLYTTHAVNIDIFIYLYGCMYSIHNLTTTMDSILSHSIRLKPMHNIASPDPPNHPISMLILCMLYVYTINASHTNISQTYIFRPPYKWRTHTHTHNPTHEKTARSPVRHPSFDCILGLKYNIIYRN